MSQRLSCAEARALIDAALDGDLEWRVAESWEHHRVECPACAAEWRMASALRHATLKMGVEHAPADLAARIGRAVRAERAAPPGTGGGALTPQPVASRAEPASPNEAPAPPRSGRLNFPWQRRVAAAVIIGVMAVWAADRAGVRTANDQASNARNPDVPAHEVARTTVAAADRLSAFGERVAAKPGAASAAPEPLGAVAAPVAPTAGQPAPVGGADRGITASAAKGDDQRAFGVVAAPPSVDLLFARVAADQTIAPVLRGWAAPAALDLVARDAPANAGKSSDMASVMGRAAVDGDALAESTVLLVSGADVVKRVNAVIATREGVIAEGFARSGAGKAEAELKDSITKDGAAGAGAAPARKLSAGAALHIDVIEVELIEADLPGLLAAVGDHAQVTPVVVGLAAPRAEPAREERATRADAAAPAPAEEAEKYKAGDAPKPVKKGAGGSGGGGVGGARRGAPAPAPPAKTAPTAPPVAPAQPASRPAATTAPPPPSGRVQASLLAAVELRKAAEASEGAALRYAATRPALDDVASRPAPDPSRRVKLRLILVDQ